MIVTVTPKGGKPIKKKFATVEEAIAFINSFNSQPPNKACSRRVPPAVTLVEPIQLYPTLTGLSAPTAAHAANANR